MNPDTGHLVDLVKMPEYRDRPGYEPVPAHLHDEAVRWLADRAEASVPKRGKGPLARHAAEQRKARRQIAKASRKANRRK
jgi:hypothetical protein